MQPFAFCLLNGLVIFIEKAIFSKVEIPFFDFDHF